MTWIITWAGTKYASDDFTLDDLGRIEKETDTPWSIANPLREIKVARAFLGVVLDRAGVPDGETRESYLSKLTLGKIKSVFEFESDDEASAQEAEEPDPLPSTPPISPSSSRGEHVGGNGRRKKPVASVSEISI